jgi:hypothetical protein
MPDAPIVCLPLLHAAAQLTSIPGFPLRSSWIRTFVGNWWSYELGHLKLLCPAHIQIFVAQCSNWGECRQRASNRFMVCGFCFYWMHPPNTYVDPLKLGSNNIIHQAYLLACDITFFKDFSKRDHVRYGIFGGAPTLLYLLYKPTCPVLNASPRSLSCLVLNRYTVQIQPQAQQHTFTWEYLFS